jgi:hypothetical protein
MAGDVERGAKSDQPADAKPRVSVTTVRTAVIVGTLVALLAGAVSSLVTVQLIGPPGDGTADIHRLEAEIASLEDLASDALSRIADLEAEQASPSPPVSEVPNPTPGPSPTVLLTVNWMRNLSPDSSEIVVCVTIENTADSAASVFYSDSQFTAFDADDFVYPPVINPYFLYTPLAFGELRPGQSRRGELPYVISQQAQPLTRLVWNTGFENMPEIAVDLPAPAAYDMQDLC